MRALWPVVIGGALAGCGNETGEPIDTPEATLDAADTIAAEATILFAILQGSEALPQSDVPFVAGLAANAQGRWLPAGCARVIQPSGTTLTFTFDDCSGPRGLVHVAGTLELRLVGWAEAPVLDVSSSGMSANASTFTVEASPLSSIAPGAEGIDGFLGGTAVGPRGHELERRGYFTMSWQAGSGCSALHASTESDPDRGTDPSPHWFTEVDVTRCPGACPTGVVVRRFPNDAEVRVEMDGTTLARWTSQGIRTETRHGTVELACE